MYNILCKKKSEVKSDNNNKKHIFAHKKVLFSEMELYNK